MVNFTGCSPTQECWEVTLVIRWGAGVRGQPTYTLKIQRAFFSLWELFTGKELCVSVFVRSWVAFYYKIHRAALSRGLVEMWYSPSLSGHPTIRDACRLLSPYCFDCGWAFHYAKTAQGNGCHALTWPEILTSSALAWLRLPGSVLELLSRNWPHHVR